MLGEKSTILIKKSVCTAYAILVENYKKWFKNHKKWVGN